MKLYHLCSGPLRVNTYFLVNERTMDAVVIDAGENYKLVKETEKKYGFKIRALLLTHAHFDHSGNAKKLQDDGVKVFISKVDAPKLKNEQNLSGDFGRKFDSLTPDYTFVDGDFISAAGITFKALLTPGHTDGSATFVVDDMMFTGDTLFLESVGRTDFVTGNREEIVSSVKRLFDLPGDYKVYPGHEEFTTLSHERKYNTFVDYD